MSTFSRMWYKLTMTSFCRSPTTTKKLRFFSCAPLRMRSGIRESIAFFTILSSASYLPPPQRLFELSVSLVIRAQISRAISEYPSFVRMVLIPVTLALHGLSTTSAPFCPVSVGRETSSRAVLSVAQQGCRWQVLETKNISRPKFLGELLRRYSKASSPALTPDYSI